MMLKLIHLPSTLTAKSYTSYDVNKPGISLSCLEKMYQPNVQIYEHLTAEFHTKTLRHHNANNLLSTVPCLRYAKEKLSSTSQSTDKPY